MIGSIGDAVLVLRRSAGITQGELAQRLDISQAALSRYENGMRQPDGPTLERIASALGVTTQFLRHDFRMRGGIAADAHMRRRRTAGPSEWKRTEAEVNELRMHSTFLLDRVPMHPENHVLHLDPDETTADEAARAQRASWRMPIGPVRNLTRWLESAGVIVAEEDFGTHRIDGMSQWAGDHAIVLVNASAPTDRKRLTLAHELGHLVMHSTYQDQDVEDQANAFAAEFLMPAHVIRPQLRVLDLGKCFALKQQWGVSVQAIIERAHDLGTLDTAARTALYKRLSRRGWRKREPGSDELPSETPTLAASIGRSLEETGLAESEIRSLIGIGPDALSPFLPPRQGLRLVVDHSA